MLLVDGARQEPLPIFEQDEIARTFAASAMPQIGYSHDPSPSARGLVASAHPLATLAGSNC
jgi:hypothetical protein